MRRFDTARGTPGEGLASAAQFKAVFALLSRSWNALFGSIFERWGWLKRAC